MHFDFGNNIALCERPVETLQNLLPFTIGCHLKDMAVQPYEDGFLLSEVPLGDGILDLKGMTTQLQAKNPNMPFSLEMITRDPLKIPIFTEGYWATFDDPSSPISGHDMARLFRLVRDNPPRTPLPRTANLSPEAQLKLEDQCIAQSIEYARLHLT